MLSTGARQLPLRHLSIRVLWNDTNWTGRVCCAPGDNISCLILRRIRETRDDTKEIALAGRAWNDLDESQLPPCVSVAPGPTPITAALDVRLSSGMMPMSRDVPVRRRDGIRTDPD